MAETSLTILTYSNFIRIRDLLISILSLRVCLGRSLRRAERFIKNSEEIAELFLDPPKAEGNLRVCFGFTSNCSASRIDRFFIEKFRCDGQ